jgi:hypothetical protein
MENNFLNFSVEQDKTNFIRKISIDKKHYGYLVQIGCQTFCFEKTKSLLKKLKLYIENPFKVERLYLSGTKDFNQLKQVILSGIDPFNNGPNSIITNSSNGTITFSGGGHITSSSDGMLIISSCSTNNLYYNYDYNIPLQSVDSLQNVEGQSVEFTPNYSYFNYVISQVSNGYLLDYKGNQYIFKTIEELLGNLEYNLEN